MVIKRRRFKQTESLQDRLEAFAREMRERAAEAEPGPRRDNFLQRASQADTAVQFDDSMKQGVR